VGETNYRFNSDNTDDREKWVQLFNLVLVNRTNNAKPPNPDEEVRSGFWS